MNNRTQASIRAERGRLITIEGVEGVGKTTHLKKIRDFLNSKGISTIATREPGATLLGEKIRALLLAKEHQINAYSELSLLYADRAAHLSEVIRPALEAGRWVVSDRFADASFAYQGGGRGVPQDLIANLSRHICAEVRPSLTLLLDLDPEEALARIAGRGDKDRFESEDLHFFQRVRRTYLELADREPQRWRVIDATHDVQTVWHEIEAALTWVLHREAQ